MKEKTKEDMLTWLGEDDVWEKAWNPLFDNKFNRKMREKICFLIENQPKVTKSDE